MKIMRVTNVKIMRVTNVASLTMCRNNNRNNVYPTNEPDIRINTGDITNDK